MPVEIIGGGASAATTTTGAYAATWGHTYANFGQINTATPSAAPGGTFTTVAGHKYIFKASIRITCDAVGGWQIGPHLSGAGTVVADIRAENSAGGGGGGDQSVDFVAVAAQGSYAGGVGDTAVKVWIEGYFTTTAAETFDLYFAESVAVPATTALLMAGSWIEIKEVP